jgi:hypothetical protein
MLEKKIVPRRVVDMVKPAIGSGVMAGQGGMQVGEGRGAAEEAPGRKRWRLDPNPTVDQPGYEFGKKGHLLLTIPPTSFLFFSESNVPLFCNSNVNQVPKCIEESGCYPRKEKCQITNAYGNEFFWNIVCGSTLECIYCRMQSNRF